jgi:hypothetical protein
VLSFERPHQISSVFLQATHNEGRLNGRLARGQATLPRSEYRSRPAVRADVLTEMIESSAKL